MRTEKLQMTYHRYSERPAILVPAQAAIKNPRKEWREGLRKHQ